MYPVIDWVRKEFEKRGINIEVLRVEERASEAELLQVIGDITGVICGDDAFTRTVLEAAPMLQIISKWGTGIDSIDQVACKDLGIAVRNVPNAFTHPVADTTMAFILNLARRSPWINRDMHTGKWLKHTGVALNGKTLGIVGLGQIGTAVAQRAFAFGMNILATDPAHLLYETMNLARMCSLKCLLQEADFVTLHCDLNPTSHHLINAVALSLMKPTAYLINTSRGPVINEAVLIRALDQRWIAGAGLDVFEEEPLPKESPLRYMDNVLLSPHGANSSPKYWQLVHEATIDNVLGILNAK
jgi:D-3-phosphoglycerate dehydrogenase